MSTFEEDLMADAENDRLTVEFIKNYLPQDVKGKFTDENLYYFLDVIGEYYCQLLDKAGDEENVDIDIDAVSAYLAEQAKKDKEGDFAPEDLRWIVDGELEYGESLDDE